MKIAKAFGLVLVEIWLETSMEFTTYAFYVFQNNFLTALRGRKYEYIKHGVTQIRICSVNLIFLII